MDRVYSPVKKFFTDKKGDIIVFQPLNLPIILWVIFNLSGYILPAGATKNAVHGAAICSLIVWAVMEIVSGVNGFRRTLGFVILASVLYSLSLRLMSL